MRDGETSAHGLKPFHHSKRPRLRPKTRPTISGQPVPRAKALSPFQEGCDKVYISTSDVQMHANYHRKDSAIQQEGFQRFRASEDCGVEMCSYQGQRTTHFHCKRPGCSYTFKNKADMGESPAAPLVPVASCLTTPVLKFVSPRVARTAEIGSR